MACDSYWLTLQPRVMTLTFILSLLIIYKFCIDRLQQVRYYEKTKNDIKVEVFKMSQIQVMLTSIEEVKNFVSLTNKYAFPIQMTTEKYKIDAKSIMGVFSLDLSKPINVVVESDAPEVQDFLAQVAQFQVH